MTENDYDLSGIHFPEHSCQPDGATCPNRGTTDLCTAIVIMEAINNKSIITVKVLDFSMSKDINIVILASTSIFK